MLAQGLFGDGRATEQSPYRKAGSGTVKKAIQIVMAREQGELDLIDRKTFNYLINRVYSELRADEAMVHRVAVADVLDFLGHTSTDRLHESLARLSSVNILIDYQDTEGKRHSVGARYLSYDMTKASDGWINFAFDPILLRFLHNPKVFATISLAHVRRFRSVYSAKLYEIMALHQNRQHPHWEPGLDQFRETMCVGEGYERFDNLRKRVIEVAVDEVNEVAPFNVDVEYIRAGRGGRVVSVRLTALPKGPRTLLEMSAAGGMTPSRRTAPRDPHTIDLLDGITDAERHPLDVSPQVLTSAQAMVDEALGAATAPVDEFLEQWRDAMRGRRLRDPGRSFTNWLDMHLARRREETLGILEEDTFATLLEQWEEGRR